MILANWSWGVAAAGAVALAGLLYLLQRLRVRRRVVLLPGAQLWAEAMRAAPARVLRDRFRYWLAYLLALVIALALWLGAGGPDRPASAAQGFHLFYLDASAAMTAPGRFAAAERALVATADAVPASRRAVYLGDGADGLVLAPGEPIALLSRRLADAEPQATPSGFARWAATLARRLQERGPAPGPVTVHYYGFPAGARDGAARLPRGTPIAYGYVAPAVRGNRGIVNLGAMPAASGAGDRVDAVVEVAAADGRPVAIDALRLTLDGKEVVPPQVATLAPGRFLFTDLPAGGAVLAASLRGRDGVPADDRAAIVLPDRHRLRVAIGAGVPAAIAAVVGGDPALVAVPVAQAEIVVRRGGDAIRPDLPALVLASPSSQADAFVFGSPDAGDPHALDDGLDQLDLSRIDAGALADRTGRPVAVTTAVAPHRSIAVWAELFDPAGGFVRSRAMPLFVSQALRWLGGQHAVVPYAQAGAALPDAADGLGTDRALAVRRLGGEAVAAAGMQTLGGRPLAVSLVDRRTTQAVGDAPSPAMAAASGGGAPVDLPFAALMLAALVLLATEWHLLQRGRMP